MELNHIIIYIQPKYDIINNKIVGSEALVRWNRPKLGMIPPDKFIGVLKQNTFRDTISQNLYLKRSMRN